MTPEIVLAGTEVDERELPSTKSLKDEFASIKPYLPSNWLDLILEFYPPDKPSNVKKLIDRLNRVFLGRAAPSLDELKLFRNIAVIPN